MPQLYVAFKGWPQPCLMEGVAHDQHPQKT